MTIQNFWCIVDTKDIFNESAVHSYCLTEKLESLSFADKNTLIHKAFKKTA